jgi:nucleotide-binding universal stress UspA family protein
MYKKILVPIDGSHTSSLGLREAIKLAKSHKARLLLVHVVEEYYAIAGGEPGPFAGEIMESMRRAGRRIIDSASALARSRGVKAQSVMLEIVSGGAADLVVRQARRWGADLIVLGTHGRRGVRRMVLGSDAEQIVRTTPVPVLLVRARPARGKRSRP